MIVKSVLENIPALGGPRGYLGMPRLTTLFWAAAGVVLTLLVLRNLVYSNFGRGITAIREDEVAANLTSVDTRRLKLYAFLDFRLLRRGGRGACTPTCSSSSTPGASPF